MASMSGSEEATRAHPLLEARPPATDYLTYLTMIEYNLKAEDLPLLNEILQDVDLTINIGWDLVMLLLPMLPASKRCLETIARLGNPREVLLKVTEALRFIEHEAAPLLPEMEDAQDASDEKNTTTPTHVHCAHGGSAELSNEKNVIPASPPPLTVQQFSSLINMLSILHPRIKTKYPSRFISTTLQAVLASLSEATSHVPALTPCVIDLVRAMSGTRRPPLPPRQSSTQVPAVAGLPVPAADPEAQVEAASNEDKLIQRRLLQAFTTHVFEVYLTSVSSKTDAPGLAWSARLFEETFPSKTVPNRATFATQFSPSGAFADRSAVAGSILSLSVDIALDTPSLVDAATKYPEPSVEADGNEDEPPNSAEEIPLSQIGALFLLLTRLTSAFLLGSNPGISTLSIFPQQAQIVRQLIGNEMSGGMATAGSEPEAIIDAIIALGLIALDHNEVGEPVDDETFMQYLQTMSLISANTPSPSLRFQAHMLTTSVLRSHPSDVVRLAFIRDTLEHCAWENLKTSAVSWIKGETLEANTPGGATGDLTVFSTPVALESLGPFLFPDLTQVFGSHDVTEKWMVFRANFGFYVASLNFYHLLLSAKHLHEPLKIGSLHSDHDIAGSMLGPLREASQAFKDSLKDGELADIEEGDQREAAMLDLQILDDILDRVEQGVVKLNET